MKNKIMKIALMAVATVAMGSLAMASNINCAGPGAGQITVTDVTALTGANTCSVIGSNLVFGNFSVAPNAGLSAATVGIAAPQDGTALVGSETDLVFQLGGFQWTGAVGSGDILLKYTVTGGLSGIDMALTSTPLTSNGSMTITEQVCDVAFVGANCQGNLLANISVSSSGQLATNSITFGADQLVYVKKDIQFNGATTSEFENSHNSSTVPEPMTLSLLGGGLLGLGLLSRRLRS